MGWAVQRTRRVCVMLHCYHDFFIALRKRAANGGATPYLHCMYMHCSRLTAKSNAYKPVGDTTFAIAPIRS
jgi:hypothetical protein